MQLNETSISAHNQKLAALLEPLGFIASSPGKYSVHTHPFIVYDLTAVNADDPKVVMQALTDMIWDRALADGRKRQQLVIREALGV